MNCFLLYVVSAYVYGIVLKANRIILFSRFGLELSLLVFLKWHSLLDFKQLMDL